MIHSICNLNKFDPIKGIETMLIALYSIVPSLSHLNKFDPIKGIETIGMDILCFTTLDLNKFDPIKGIETS